jgi:hypothetical protein
MAVVSCDGLLDSYRTSHALDRAGEGHHQPIAEVLDLFATGGRHGISEELEMGAADLFAGVVSQLVEQRRRPDEVGEEQRDDSSHVAPEGRCCRLSRRSSVAPGFRRRVSGSGPEQGTDGTGGTKLSSPNRTSPTLGACRAFVYRGRAGVVRTAFATNKRGQNAMFSITKSNRRFQTRALLLALGLATLPGVWPVAAETTVTGSAQGRASLATDTAPDGAGEQMAVNAASQAQIDIHGDLSIRSSAGDGAVSGILASGGGSTGDSGGAVSGSAGLSSSGACPATTGGLKVGQGNATTTIGLVLAWLGSCGNDGPGGQPGGPGSGGPGSGGPGSGGPGSGDPSGGLPIDVLGVQVPGTGPPGGGNPGNGDQGNGDPENGHPGSNKPGDGPAGNGLPGGLLPSRLPSGLPSGLPGGLLPSGLPSGVLPGTLTRTPTASKPNPVVSRSGGTGVGGRALPGTLANEIRETPAAGALNDPANVGPAQSADRPPTPLGEMPRTGADLHLRALVGLGLLGLAGLRRRPRSIQG